MSFFLSEGNAVPLASVEEEEYKTGDNLLNTLLMGQGCYMLSDPFLSCIFYFLSFLVL